MEFKKCRVCKEEKLDTEEFWNVTSTLGKFLSGVCKDCEKTKKVSTKNQPGKKVWERMIRRCESPKDPSWSSYGELGVYVAEDMRSFDKFSDWYKDNYIDGWELDKDILGTGKVYSQEFCCFVPDYINSFFCFKKKSLVPRKYGRKFKLDFNLGEKRTISLIMDTEEECTSEYYKKKDDRMKELFSKMQEEYLYIKTTGSPAPINLKLIEVLSNFSTREWHNNYKDKIATSA